MGHSKYANELHIVGFDNFNDAVVFIELLHVRRASAISNVFPDNARRYPFGLLVVVDKKLEVPAHISELSELLLVVFN